MTGRSQKNFYTSIWKSKGCSVSTVYPLPQCYNILIACETSRAEARPVPCPFYLKPVQYYPTFYLITTEGIQSNSNMTQMAIWYNVQILGLWELRVKLQFDSIQIGLWVTLMFLFPSSKMSESQTKAGNQEKFEKIENLKNLKFLKI